MAVENLLARILLRFRCAVEYGANTPEITFRSVQIFRVAKVCQLKSFIDSYLYLSPMQAWWLGLRFVFLLLLRVYQKGGPTQGRLNLTNHHYKEPTQPTDDI